MTILPELEKQLVRAAGALGESPRVPGPRRFGLRRASEAIALVAAVAAVIAVVVVIASAGRGSQPAAPLRPASAAAALDEAARAAAAGTLSPTLRRGQAWFAEEVRAYVSPAVPGGGLSGPVGRDIWTWQSWSGRSGAVSGGFISIGGGGGAAGAPGFSQWSGSFISQSAFRSPARLLRALGGFGGYFGYNVPGGSPVQDTDTSPLTKLAKAAALLGEVQLRPVQRAVVFRAIAQLPGLTYLGSARDALGRPGVAVAATGSPRVLDAAAPQRYQLELIFDASRGKVLGFRTIALQAVRAPADRAEGVPRAADVKAGELIFAWAYEHTGIVGVADLPSLVCTSNQSPSRCETILGNAINKQQARRLSMPPASTPVAKFRTPVNGVLTVKGKGIAHVNLTSPDHRRLPTGNAEITRNGKRYSIIVVAGGVSPATGHGVYALWLTGGPRKNVLLGIVSPDVGANSHRVDAAGPVPADALSYRLLVISAEHNAHPSVPGQVILQGPLTRGR